MPDPSLILYANSVRIAANEDWLGAADVVAASTSLGAFPFSSTRSLDAALVRPITGGHTVEVTGAANAVNPATNFGKVIVEVYDAGAGAAARLTSLSALNRVGTGADILIAGFTLTGSGKKRVLVRAVGPRLAAAPFNIGGVLLDPRLEIFTAASPPVRIDQNDNWAASLTPIFSSVGSFLLNAGSLDAALVVELDASPSGTGYTVQVSGVGNTTGLAIVEVYELP
jgi:hypothetical protein